MALLEAVGSMLPTSELPLETKAPCRSVVCKRPRSRLADFSAPHPGKGFSEPNIISFLLCTSKFLRQPVRSCKHYFTAKRLFLPTPITTLIGLTFRQSLKNARRRWRRIV